MKLRDYGNPVLGLACGHCGNMSEHVSDLALLVSEEQAIDYCRYYDNHHLEVVKGFFLNSIYKEWGMTYHQASARFLLDRIPLIDRRRSHLVANPGVADDERDDELAAEQAAGDAAVNGMVEALANPDLGPQPTPTPGAGPRSWEHQAPSGRPVPDSVHT